MKANIPQAKPQNAFVRAEIADDKAGGHALREDGCQRRTLNPQMKAADQSRVQHNVRRRADGRAAHADQRGKSGDRQNHRRGTPTPASACLPTSGMRPMNILSTRL